MRAIVYREYGSPAVLRLEELPKPTPDHGEALVRVYASSINSWDFDLLKGSLFNRFLSGLLSPKYTVLGADIAGRVEAVGDGATRLQSGDEVYGDLSASGFGGFAEYVCVREDTLELKPSNLTFEEAAAVPQAGVIALQGLQDYIQIQPGQRVLVNGAGGGVGVIAVQLAKHLGADVTGVDSAGKLEMVRTIGADQVIDYTAEDFTGRGRHYDLILDIAGYRSLFDNRRALSPAGTYLIVGGSTPRIVQVMLLGPLISRTGGKQIGIVMHQPNRNLSALSQLLEKGSIRPIIDRRYLLEDISDAFRYFGAGNAQGKIVITIT